MAGDVSSDVVIVLSARESKRFIETGFRKELPERDLMRLSCDSERGKLSQILVIAALDDVRGGGAIGQIRTGEVGGLCWLLRLSYDRACERLR